MTPVDYTRDWSKDHICRYWKHPDTLIRILHSTLSGYNFLFDTRGGQRTHWYFERIRDAKAAVQEVMDGRDGSANR